MIVAFDADVLIYAATVNHPLGSRILPLLRSEDVTRVGSVLLLTEILARPMREDPHSAETAALVGVLSRLDLRVLDEAAARLALVLSISYGLRAADAAHLAIAVAAGADRFVTNNRKDFCSTIAEVQITYPDELRFDGE